MECEGALNVNATGFPNSFVKQCTGLMAGTHCFASHVVLGSTHEWARGCCSPDDAVTGEIFAKICTSLPMELSLSKMSVLTTCATSWTQTELLPSQAPS